MLNSFRRVVPSSLIQMRNMSGSQGLKLAGKVAVVTASTDGIGFAIAERLSQDGAKVVISSRKQSNVSKALELLKSKGHSNVIGTVCHVSKQEHRSALFKTAIENFGKIDILVSNAAANPSFGSVFECSEEAWDKIFDVNVKCTFLLTKEVLPYMRENGGGSIVYVASIAAFVPISLLGAYSVSKTALLGLTKVCATELAPENIRVNCLAPGVIETKFSSAITGNEVAREASLEMIPMGRFGSTQEMGSVASFLCSDDASFITGETIVASGGMISRL